MRPERQRFVFASWLGRRFEVQLVMAVLAKNFILFQFLHQALELQSHEFSNVIRSTIPTWSMELQRF